MDQNRGGGTGLGDSGDQNRGGGRGLGDLGTKTEAANTLTRQTGRCGRATAETRSGQVRTSDYDTCGWPTVTRTRAGRLHPRCARRCTTTIAAKMRRCRGGSAAGRPAGGLEQRSSQAELDVRPPPSLFLSPRSPPSLFLSLACSRGKSLEREISRAKSSICRVNSCPFAFGTDARSIPVGLW